MTLSIRNLFFKIGIFFCALVLLLTLVASFLTISNSTEIQELLFGDNCRRPSFIFNVLTGSFLGNSYLAVHVVLILTSLFSFVAMLLIHSFFERTITSELLFITFFTVSISFEVFRLFLPLQLLLNFPFYYLRYSARVLLFARFFGIFSLFTAGLYAAGLDGQKNRYAVFILVVTALIIPIGVPIDAHLSHTNFNLIHGNVLMFRMIEIIVFIITIISFFIAAKIRSSKEYVSTAVGVMLALIGRYILLSTDNWIGAVQGILLLSFGTHYLCSKVHKIHLWL